MSGKYKYAGLTKELHQRLTLEFDALREEHRRTLTKYIMETKKCKLENIFKGLITWLKSVRNCQLPRWMI